MRRSVPAWKTKLPKKATTPAVLSSLEITNESDVEQLRARLADLEREIVQLRAGSIDDSADVKIAQLEKLLKEKEQREKQLDSLLSSLQQQLNQQQKTIQMLLKKVELNVQR